MLYVAFLRGINVGGHTVKMDRLRQELEALGLHNVSTFIASGNVVFESDVDDLDDLESRIEAHLAGAFGYDVATFVRTDAELAAVAAHHPFPTIARTDIDRTYVVFLKRSPERSVEHATDIDLLEHRGRELFWLSRTPLAESGLTYADWARLLGDMPTTVRNVNTVHRLAAKLGPVRAP